MKIKPCTDVEVSFPPEKELKRIRKLLGNPRTVGNVMLPDNATLIQKTKYEICQKIAKYKREKGLDQKELSKLLGVDASRTSDILYGKIYRFSLDRLIEIFQKIYPKVKIKLVA